MYLKYKKKYTFEKDMQIHSDETLFISSKVFLKYKIHSALFVHK